MLEIPQKSTFRLDEVCEIADVKPYVLRFWESEFPEIDPITSSSGQKIYEHKDIEVISKLRGFLFDEKLSVEQVKLRLKNPSANVARVQTKEDSVEFEQTPADYCDRDLQKLVLAKAKLQSIISKTQAMKSAYNWL